MDTSFQINRNLASSVRNFLKKQGCERNISERDMDTILQRMAQIDKDRDTGKTEGGSIFKGGHKYLGGSSKDFIVQQGQVVNLSKEEYNKLFEGFLNPIADKKNIIADDLPKDGIAKIIAKAEIAKAPKIELPPEKPTENDKILTREVNGVKQNICIRKENGHKVRYAMNEDGTLGDMLIPKTTVGKNTYVTATQMGKDMRTVLGLGENDKIPADIQGSYVQVAGEPVLVFKQDGKILDQKQLREYVKNLHETKPAPAPQANVKNDNASAVQPEPIAVNIEKLPAEVVHPSVEEVVALNSSAVVDNAEVVKDPEAPKVEAPKVEAPKVEAPKVETPKASETKAPEESKQWSFKNLPQIKARIASIEQEFNIPEGADHKIIRQIFAKANTNAIHTGDKEAQKNIAEKSKEYQNSKSFVKIMENWQDGRKFDGRTLDGKEYTREQATLPNGERAYKIDGKYYQVGPNGPIGYPNNPMNVDE